MVITTLLGGGCRSDRAQVADVVATPVSLGRDRVRAVESPTAFVLDAGAIGGRTTDRLPAPITGPGDGRIGQVRRADVVDRPAGAIEPAWMQGAVPGRPRRVAAKVSLVRYSRAGPALEMAPPLLGRPSLTRAGNGPPPIAELTQKRTVGDDQGLPDGIGMAPPEPVLGSRIPAERPGPRSGSPPRR